MSATTTFGSCADFVTQLQESRLVTTEDLPRMAAYVKAFPQRGAADLARFLVEQGVLTRFQANVVLEGKARDLLLSQFTLTDVIGSGSMGTVFKARVSDRDGLYAVKIVPRRNAVGLGSVVEKVKALKEIRHPRVSALVHLGASGERVYLAWPFLEGGEKLDEFVRRQGKLSARQAMQVALQVASGLQAYHAHGLFHGLLKPSDVLIGADKRVRILDFGVGFLLVSERGKSLLDTMTNSKTLARGVDCASPESLLDPLNRTPLGDQYSLGCILYFCLAGRFPFAHENPVKKMLAHQAEEPEDIRELNEEVPPRLAAVLRRMMAKRPEDRFPTTDDVVQSLQSLAGPGRGSAPGMFPRSPGSAPGTTPRPTGSAPGTLPRPVEPDPVAPSQVESSTVAPTRVSGRVGHPTRCGDMPSGGLWKNALVLTAGLAAGAVLGVLTWLLTHG
jgi:serine/threonine protein kinase